MSSYHTMEVMHITALTLLVKDMSRSIEFYQDILGLTMTEARDKTTHWSANGSDVFLRLIEDRNALPYDYTLGLYHVAWLVPDKQAFIRVIQRLSDKRYPLTGAAFHGVSEAIYLDDPDGNGIEIYHDLDPSLWPMDQGQLSMVTEPLDLSSLMNALPFEPNHPMNPKTVLGHLHLHVADLKESLVFYQDALGFQIVQEYLKSACFLSDASYHHHLGLNTWQKDAPLCKEKQVGLKAYDLHVPKSQYLSFMHRMQAHHVPWLTEDGQIYVLDPLGQKIYVKQ